VVDRAASERLVAALASCRWSCRPTWTRIASLEEPRRTEIEQLHGLIRETVPELVRFKRTDDIDLGALRELVAEAGRIGPAAEGGSFRRGSWTSRSASS